MFVNTRGVCVQLQTFLGILTETHSLTLATANVTAGAPALLGLPPRGPGPPPKFGPDAEGPPMSPGAFEAMSCSVDSLGASGGLVNQGLSSAVIHMGYDYSLFSYVGCRCNAGYDNVYSLNATGW